jgi:hypothetical protein
MPLAFANIYADLAEAIRVQTEGRTPNLDSPAYPTVEDGLRAVAAIQAAVESARNGGQWLDARPPSFR